MSKRKLDSDALDRCTDKSKAPRLPPMLLHEETALQRLQSIVSRRKIDNKQVQTVIEDLQLILSSPTIYQKKKRQFICRMLYCRKSAVSQYLVNSGFFKLICFDDTLSFEEKYSIITTSIQSLNPYVRSALLCSQFFRNLLSDEALSFTQKKWVRDYLKNYLSEYHFTFKLYYSDKEQKTYVEALFKELDIPLSFKHVEPAAPLEISSETGTMTYSSTEVCEKSTEEAESAALGLLALHCGVFAEVKASKEEETKPKTEERDRFCSLG